MVTSLLQALVESSVYPMLVVWAAVVLVSSLVIAFAMKSEHGLGEQRYADTSRPLPTFNPFEVVAHHFFGRLQDVENRVIYRIEDVAHKMAMFDQRVSHAAEEASASTADAINGWMARHKDR